MMFDPFNILIYMFFFYPNHSQKLLQKFMTIN